VNVLPPMMMVPVRSRSGPPGSRDTENPTLPSPDPVAPEVTVIHEVSVTAVQAHPIGADTSTVPVVS
jgi:hypothetical protein